jgi:3D (Asp-Asp-Asp) domain-containing protein
MDKTRTTSRVTTTTRVTKTTRGAKRAVAVSKPRRIGSAAADWSRWPMGTTFRLLSTGQMYRVEDYGWALSGRNTIDLYMANQRNMNSWGARREPIQILQWGDPRQSLLFLQSHQDYKHIKRMVLELEGREQEAAQMQ